MRNKPDTTTLALALLWEGEKPIPYRFDEPLRRALVQAVTEIYQEQRPEDKEPIQRYNLISNYQPPELGKLLEEICICGKINIHPWDFFEAARGCWWQGGPLKPGSESYFKELKAELREHFGESYEVLAQHFVPHFQRLAADYR